MKKIYRYSLEITDRPKLTMPQGAEILPSPPNPRGSGIEIWAQVDDTQPLEIREFRIVGTGNPMLDDYGRFIGTVVTHGGSAVWHIFEAAS